LAAIRSMAQYFIGSSYLIDSALSRMSFMTQLPVSGFTQFRLTTQTVTVSSVESKLVLVDELLHARIPKLQVAGIVVPAQDPDHFSNSKRGIDRAPKPNPLPWIGNGEGGM